VWQPCSLSSLPGDPAPAAAGRARKQVLYQTRLRPSWEPTSSRSLFLHGATISSLWMPLAGKKEKNNEQGIGNREQRNLSSWRFWNRYDPTEPARAQYRHRFACFQPAFSLPGSLFIIPCSLFPVPYSLFVIQFPPAAPAVQGPRTEYPWRRERSPGAKEKAHRCGWAFYKVGKAYLRSASFISSFRISR
jgi:hypothetical protein